MRKRIVLYLIAIGFVCAVMFGWIANYVSAHARGGRRFFSGRLSREERLARA